jgi:hypothetical protein
VVEEFIRAHPQAKPIVVADAAMLDEDRLTELRQKNLSYIVGARLANASLELVKQIHITLKGLHGVSACFPTKHGEVVCDFSINGIIKNCTS